MQEQRLWRIEQNDTLWKIAKEAFGLNTDREITNKVAELGRLNPQIRDVNYIRAGSLVFLGNPSGHAAPTSTTDIQEVESCLNSATPQTRNLMLNQWNALQFLTDELKPQGPTFLSQVAMKPSALVQSCSGTLCQTSSLDTFVKITGTTSDLADASFKTFTAGTAGTFGRFRAPSPQVFQTLEGQIIQGVKRQIRYAALRDGSLRLVPNGGRAFSMNGKVIVFQPGTNTTGLRGFGQATRAIKATAETLERYGGKIAIGIDLGVGIYEVGKQWDTPERNVTIARESSKFAAKTAFGALAAAPLATMACGAVAVFSVGIGGVACFLVVTAGSTYLVGEVGGALGEGAYGIFASPQPVSVLP